MDKTNLTKRMKRYERTNDEYLTPRMPVIIRLDLQAGSTFTKHFNKPFDKVFWMTMQRTMKYLCEIVPDVKIGYTQSDEISLLLTDYEKINKISWFDYRVNKLTSIIAGKAAVYFNKEFQKHIFALKCVYIDPYSSQEDFNNLIDNYEYDLSILDLIIQEHEEFNKLIKHYNTSLESNPVFDCRVFNVPKEDVCNYFYWRQNDAEKNSILSLGQSMFSHKTLYKKSCKDILQMLRDKDNDWINLPLHLQRGACCIRVQSVKQIDQLIKNKYEKKEFKKKLKELKECQLHLEVPENLQKFNSLHKDLYETVEVPCHEWQIDRSIPLFLTRDTQGEDGRLYIEKYVYPELYN